MSVTRPLMNNRGSLTVEMIFGLMLAFGVGLVLFAVSFSLTTIEIAQYMSYSAARVQIAARKDLSSQEQQAVAKFKSLQSKIFGPNAEAWFAFGNPHTWTSSIWSQNFNIDNALNTGAGVFDWSPNQGFGFELTLKLLGIKVPFLGQAGKNDEFDIFISSLLMRHPNDVDCKAFWGENRGEALRDRLVDRNGASRFSASALDTSPTVDIKNVYAGDIAHMMQENACGPNP